MKFVVKKEDLYNGIKIVERATSMKALQPVLLNIYIETIDTSAIRLIATDLDFTVTAVVDAQIEEPGKITLPSKTLNEIVSKTGNELITFSMQEGETIVNIKAQNSSFDIIGIAASEFPPEIANVELHEENSFEIAVKPLTKAVKQAAAQHRGPVFPADLCRQQGHQAPAAHKQHEVEGQSGPLGKHPGRQGTDRMEQKVINRRMHVVGLHPHHVRKPKLLPRQHPKFIQDGFPRFPLPVRGNQAGGHIGRIVGVIFVVMESCFFHTKTECCNHLQHQKDSQKPQKSPFLFCFLHLKRALILTGFSCKPRWRRASPRRKNPWSA